MLVIKVWEKLAKCFFFSNIYIGNLLRDMWFFCWTGKIPKNTFAKLGNIRIFQYTHLKIEQNVTYTPLRLGLLVLWWIFIELWNSWPNFEDPEQNYHKIYCSKYHKFSVKFSTKDLFHWLTIVWFYKKKKFFISAAYQKGSWPENNVSVENT